MKELIREKLKSRKGESIAEVLVALLISALALVMLASMITSSSSMIQKSRAKLQAYYKANNVLETRTGDVSGNGEITITITTDDSPAVTYTTCLKLGDSGAAGVYYYKNAEAPSGKQVVSYKLK